MNPSTPPKISPKQKIMETWFQEVWTNKNVSMIDKMFPENGEAKAEKTKAKAKAK